MLKINLCSILHYAIATGNLKTARLLIENNANLNVQDKHGDTALHLAIKRDFMDLAQLLIEKKVDLNVQDKHGDTALHLAINMSFIGLAQLLIENNADLNVQDNYGDTPLHLAINIDSIDLARLLIKNNADLNVQDNYGDTPLHLAINIGSIDLAQLLIKNNTDLNIQGQYNKSTALFLAAHKGYDNLVKEIVKANVDLSATNIDDDNLLTYYRYKPEMIEFFMFHGIDYDLLRTALINVVNNTQSSHDMELISKIYSYFMDDNTRISLKLEGEDNDRYAANLKDALKAIVINNKNLEFKNLFLELVKQKLKDCEANIGQGDNFIEDLLKASKSKHSILKIKNNGYKLHELINQFKDFIFSEDSVQYFNRLIGNASRIHNKLQMQKEIKINNITIETNLIIPLIQKVAAKQNDSTAIMNRLLIELIDAATIYASGASSCIKGILNKLATTIIDCIKDNDQSHIFPFKGYMVNYNELLATILKLDKDKNINPIQELNELDAQKIRSLIYRIIKTDILPNEEFVKIVYYGESENVFYNKDNITQFRMLLTYENLSEIQQKILVKNMYLKYKIPAQFLPCLGDNDYEISYRHNVSDKMLLQNIIANLHDLADDNEKSCSEFVQLIKSHPEKLNLEVAGQLQREELLAYLGNTYNQHFCE